jgi:cell wall-associated NlpC family hydrolase
MTWDATAYDVTIHALGVVEASMDYGASAPGIISIGLLQWYGTRAAELLFEIQSGDPTDFASCPASLVTDMSLHPATDHWWNGKSLLTGEESGLKTMLRLPNVQTIQLNKAKTDVDDYLSVAAAGGMDKDANTKAVEFFCNMYNQSPVAANRVLSSAGPDSSLDRLLSYCLNDSTLGQYASRYHQAYTIINANDAGLVNVSGSSTGGSAGDPGGITRPTTNSKYIQKVDSGLWLYNKDGSIQKFYKSSGDTWVAATNNAIGVPPVSSGSGSPPPSGAAATIVAYENSLLGTIPYSQGPGRLDFTKSGYTDCSGLQYRVFLNKAGIDIGTVTGEQIHHGNLISTNPTDIRVGNGLVAGDLILYRWSPSSPNTYDHVALYDGAGNTIGTTGNSGEDPGPNKQAVNINVDYAISGGGSVMARRYL